MSLKQLGKPRNKRLSCAFLSLLSVLVFLWPLSGLGASLVDPLLFAILDKERYASEPSEVLRMQYQLSKPGRLSIALCPFGKEEAPLKRWSLSPDALPKRFIYDLKLEGSPLPLGIYSLYLKADGDKSPTHRLDFSVQIPNPAPNLSAADPELFLPTQNDDASIWKALIAPIAVVNIGVLQHQSILDSPSQSGKELGQVHGQTAGVEILELGINGYARVRAFRQGDGLEIRGYLPEKKLKMILPSQVYGLVVDKARQIMAVFQNGRRLGEIPVSTGLYKPDEGFLFETSSGAYLCQDRQMSFSSQGFRYDYSIRIDGGNLIHQIGCKRSGKTDDFSIQEAELGKKTSHGCIRLPHQSNAQGLNAFWLYTHLPENTKVLVLPDQFENAKAEITPIKGLDEAGESDQVLTLSFMGDCVLGGEEKSRKKPLSFENVLVEKGLSWPFSGVLSYSAQDDLTMVNLEGVLQNSEIARTQGLLHNFRGLTDYTALLKSGSIEAVNLANNHHFDYGKEGSFSTLQTLEAENILYSGYGHIQVFEKNKLKIGLGGIRETIYKKDPAQVDRDLAALKALGCDYIVYHCHFGREYADHHNDLQRTMAHHAIDRGANLIIGHHPHVVQGVEAYQNGFIFYSLGNFVFGGNLDLSTFDGLMIRARLFFQEKALKKAQFSLIPVLTSGSAPQNDFRPIPALNGDKERILTRVNNDSAQYIPEHFEIQAHKGENK